MPVRKTSGRHALLMAVVRSRMAVPPAPRKAPGYWHSPEYKRLQREQEAAQQGRVLCEYLPQSDREREAAGRRADNIAIQTRKRFAASLLKEFSRIASTFPEVASELRKEHAAQARTTYHRHPVKSRLKVTRYKATHVEKVIGYHETRQERIDSTCDGTATCGEYPGGQGSSVVLRVLQFSISGRGEADGPHDCALPWRRT